MPCGSHRTARNVTTGFIISRDATARVPKRSPDLRAAGNFLAAGAVVGPSPSGRCFGDETIARAWNRSSDRLLRSMDLRDSDDRQLRGLMTKLDDQHALGSTTSAGYEPETCVLAGNSPVEPTGVEPVTSCLQTCAHGPALPAPLGLSLGFAARAVAQPRTRRRSRRG
jgi:hypothetical protein